MLRVRLILGAAGYVVVIAAMLFLGFLLACGAFRSAWPDASLRVEIVGSVALEVVFVAWMGLVVWIGEKRGWGSGPW